MQLTEPEVKDFFRLLNGLLLYVNERKGLYPKIKDQKGLEASGAEPQSKLTSAVYDDPDLITQYCQNNPRGLAPGELDTVQGWLHFLKGKFMVYRFTEDNTIFIRMDGGDPPKAYGVMSLNRPLGMLVGPNLPVMVETTLLPFRDRIVYDGLIATFGMSFGKGMRSVVDGWYDQAMKEGGLITDLGKAPVGKDPGKGPRDPEGTVLSDPPTQELRTSLGDPEAEEVLSELNEVASRATAAYNNAPLEDFEGLSPHQMRTLLCSPLDPEHSPLILHEDLPEDLLKCSKFYLDLRTFLMMVRAQGEVRLTAHGNLGTDFVKALCQARMLEEDSIFFQRPRKVYREKDSYYIQILDVLCELAGLTRRREGALALTPVARSFLDGPQAKLYLYLFTTYATGYNWGYPDGYEAAPIIQRGFGFLLYLLTKHRGSEQGKDLYAKAFERAFPQVLSEFDAHRGTRQDRFRSCFIVRAIDRFAVRFGLVEVLDEDKPHDLDDWWRWKYQGRIHTTPLFERLVGWREGDEDQFNAIPPREIRPCQNH